MGNILLVLFHAIIKKGVVNLLKNQLTAHEIRYCIYSTALYNFYATSEVDEASLYKA